MAFIAAQVAISFEVRENVPTVLNVAGIAVYFVGLCVLSLWLFRPKDPFGLKTQEEFLRELKESGQIETSAFSAMRAFGVEEFEDEGLSYYLELDDGRVLFLNGQYLYDVEPMTDDPEYHQKRRFPCSRFTILRHKTEGYAVDIQCHGTVIEPEFIASPFRDQDWREGSVPEDGEIISHTGYDGLKEMRSQG